MRVCKNPGCGASLDGRRRQAIYRCGSCPAAASRARNAERAVEADSAVGFDERTETAQKRTDGVIRPQEYGLASPAEEARYERLIRDHSDLWGEAA
jgi:hypothetical protein